MLALEKESRGEPTSSTEKPPKKEKRQNKKINRRSFDVAVERVSHKHHNG
jgi:hypothetical protein